MFTYTNIYTKIYMYIYRDMKQGGMHLCFSVSPSLSLSIYLYASMYVC